jgi:hypothetical protein
MEVMLRILPLFVLVIAVASCTRLGFAEDPLLGAQLDTGRSDLDAGPAPDAPMITPDAPPITPDAPPITPDASPITPDAPPITPDAPPVTPDAALISDLSIKPDLSCAPNVSQTATNGGYVSVATVLSYGQAFTAQVTGTLREVEIYEQTLNGGENHNLWLAVMTTASGAPAAVVAERKVGPLTGGWVKYLVDFSSAQIKLQAGTSYVLRLRSESPQHTRHTVAFGVYSSTGVGALYAKQSGPWELAPKINTFLKSTHAIYFRVITCQ